MPMPSSHCGASTAASAPGSAASRCAVKSSVVIAPNRNVSRYVRSQRANAGRPTAASIAVRNM